MPFETQVPILALQFGPSVTVPSLTMASADFCLCFPFCCQFGTRYAGRGQTSPGSHLVFPPTPPNIPPPLPHRFGASLSWTGLPGATASYPVRIPRFGSSSTPSFPPRRTTTQLASSYGSPCRARSGLAPLHNIACRAHLRTDFEKQRHNTLYAS